MAFARRGPLASLFAVLALFIDSAISAANCEAFAFQDLRLSNGKIQSIVTQIHKGLSFEAPAEANHYSVNVTDLEACEVTITYTHPGYNDTINTSVWLPALEKWTGRFLGAGGSGWSTGPDTNTTLPWAASEGFAAVATDGGHVGGDIEWSLVSPGNIDWILLQDFSSIALDDAATLGKAVTTAYYGKAPSYSYWNGCSTGGRQGHMLAQRYPDQYDGILATAPAIYWSQLMLQLFWPQVVMNENGFPTPCELEAINTAAIQACDKLDGLEDGIISLSRKCSFDPATIVGKQYICPSSNQSTTITETAATVAKLIWQGATTAEGDFLWYPDNIGAPFDGLANTTCTNNDTCVGVPFFLPEIWIKDFLTLDREFDTAKINTTYFEELFHQSVNYYDSIIGTSDPNLDGFRRAGGKLINWQGLADQFVAPDATIHYVKEVYGRDSKASDYYRFFEAPGINHCGGGQGYYPGEGLKALVNWVENGVAPETLSAETPKGRKVNICMWPKQSVYVGGNPDAATSFECQ